MLEKMKERVYLANMELEAKGVVIYTWGNVSEIDRASGIMAIKPSGVEYSDMKPEDMVLVEVATGKVVEGSLRPSSDTPTHLALYREFPEIGGVTHTHSTCAVSFAQAGRDIPALGTTHADYFYGDISCTRPLTRNEVEDEYEANTGKVIIEEVRRRGYDIMSIPGIIVRNHGPFTWGKDGMNSVFNSVVMEKIAEMALHTLFLSPNATLPQYILDKHYNRKHGANAYYGQKK